jgi:hypothetical protein
MTFWWVYLIISVTAWLITVKIMMHRIAATEIAKRRDDPVYCQTAKTFGWSITNGEDLGLASIVGLVIGMLWPAAIIGGFLLLLFHNFEPKIERDYEQAQRDAEELKRLRELARKHNLPMPETDKGNTP